MSETSNAPSAFNAPNDVAETATPATETLGTHTNGANTNGANNGGDETAAVAAAETPAVAPSSPEPPSPEDSPPETAPAEDAHAEGAHAEQPIAARLTHGLEVEVRFQLGEVVMPLAALANLKPEQVLTELDGVHFPKVKAVSAGRAFAEGELVRVGEQIGFRVTKVYP